MHQCPHCHTIIPVDKVEADRIRASERERVFTLMSAITLTIPIDMEMERLGHTWMETRKVKAPLPVEQLRELLSRY